MGLVDGEWEEVVFYEDDDPDIGGVPESAFVPYNL